MAKPKKSPELDFNNGDSDNQSDSQGGGGLDFTLTKEHRQAIMSAVYHTEKLKLEKEALTEDVKAIAAKIGCKPGDVSGMVSMIIQERAKGGVIQAKERALDLAKQILDSDDIGQIEDKT
jgi:hypothetical protein